MDADTLLTFLWEGDIAGCNYDPENMTKGLFKGYLLLCVHLSLYFPC